MKVYTRNTDGTKTFLGPAWLLEIVAPDGTTFSVNDPQFKGSGIDVRTDGTLIVLPEASNAVNLHAIPFGKPTE